MSKHLQDHNVYFVRCYSRWIIFTLINNTIFLSSSEVFKQEDSASVVDSV